jgi:GAF domain-containing protein
MRLAIHVYGRVAESERESFDGELRKVLAPTTSARGATIATEYFESYPQAIGHEARRPCEARVFVISEPADVPRSGRFFLALMNQAQHVPVVFVGASLKNRFRPLGVAWYVEAREWRRVAAAVKQAIETGWWWIVEPIELPVMIVDRDHVVVEANRSALARFGADIVGRPYAEGVEKLPACTKLPPTHPIREALGPQAGPSKAQAAPVGICRYHDVVLSDGGLDGNPARRVERRAQLVCLPLTNLGRVITSVVVFDFDLRHFDRINEAAKAFATAEGVESLQQSIVDQVHRMGYARVRLYEYVPGERQLHGRKSVGFRSAGLAEDFRSRVVRVPDPGKAPAGGPVDAVSHNTINKRYPSLFIYHDSAKKDPESDLVHYCERGNDSAELEKEDVERWVDVPILIPDPDSGGGDEEDRPPVRPWGKLSVDDAGRSDRLSPRDVADMNVLAAVAGGAIAEKLRAEREKARALRDQQLLDIYDEYTRRLDSEEWRGFEGRVMERVKTLLLELYRKLFNLDVAIYREFYPEGRTLRYDGVISMEAGALPDDCRPPRDVTPEDYESLARFGREFVDEEGGVGAGKDIGYYCLDHAHEQTRRMMETRPDLSEAERRYLGWVRSEIGIPILVRNKVRGVIFGLSPRPEAFPADRDIVLRRFTNIARLWFQIGELYDARTTAIKHLGDSLKAWSLLPQAEDQSFYAGMAAILTAGTGLGWNRALIFRSLHAGQPAARLVYAIGGRGEDEHRNLMKWVEDQETDLIALVKKRIGDPIPHGPDEQGRDRIDSLYALYCLEPDRAVTVSVNGADSPLRAILDPDPGVRVPFRALHRGDPALDALAPGHPELFKASTTYFFPLYPTQPEQTGPLGFIALDNAYRPNPLEDTVLPLTLAMVELVRDAVDARLLFLLISGMLGALPFFRHGPNIKDAWDLFFPPCDRLLTALEAGLEAPPGLREVRETLSRLDEPVQHMVDAQNQVQAWRNIGSNLSSISDLKGHLLRLAEGWRSRFTFEPLSIALDDGLELPCDPVILDNALRCLLENAASVTDREQLDAKGRVPVSIKASQRRDVYRFERVVTIEVRDFGPGIPRDKEPFLFIDGFTERDDLVALGAPADEQVGHKGLGLGLARASLLRARGELRLESGGGGGQGATFAIHFGLPGRKTASPRRHEGPTE